MSYPVFHVPSGDVLPIFFDSFDGGTGASITLTGLLASDVEIFKDGSATQRASDAGITLLDTDGIDFDGITGIHGFSIDTGDNTDAGFYSVGAWFTVVVSAVTIDAQTVSFVAAQFRIMAAEGVAGVPDVNTTHVSDTAQTANDNGADINAILADTNELQGDWANGGRLDLILDIIAADTTTDIPATLTTILADTGELQTDLVNGGRLDLLIDAIKAKTDNLPAAPAATGDIPSAATVADAVWDEAQADHVGAGTFGVTASEIASILDDTDLIDDGTSGLAKIATDVAAILVDTSTTLQVELDGIQADTEDIQARIPAALTGAGNIKADVLAISGDVTAADRLEALMDGLIVAQVNDAGASTTAFIADGFTEATNDHLNGRLITFLTGALTGQQTSITDYVGASQTFTVVALTEAPANDDFFVVH